MGNKKTHDEKILSHIKWASNLIFREFQKIDKKSNDALEFVLKANPSFTADDPGPIKFYRFKYPLGNLEKDGITTSLFQEIRIWQEKEFEYIEKPRSWFGEVKITSDKVKFNPEEYFVLDIDDKSRKLLKTIKGSRLFPESYSYYETPSIRIVLREKPLRDLRERKRKPGQDFFDPREAYVSSMIQKGVLPFLIPKSLKPTRIKSSRPNCEVYFYRKKQNLKPIPRERVNLRWLLADHSYQALDYLLQISIYSVQQGLLSGIDCLLEDFDKYVSAKFEVQKTDDRKSSDRSVEEVGYYYDDYENANGDEFSKYVLYNAPRPNKSRWLIKLGNVNKDILRKALQYIVKSYYLPYNPTTFEVYARKTIAGILKPSSRKPYQSKINPDKEMRKEIIKLRAKRKSGNVDAARKWVYRKQNEGWSLTEIYSMI